MKRNFVFLGVNLLKKKKQQQRYLSRLCFQCLIVGSKDVFFLLLGVPQSTSLAGVIALSCVVVVLLIIVCGLIWQRRRAVPRERIQGEENVSFEGVEPSPDRQSNDEQASDLNTYLELKPRPSNHEQSHVPSEYQSLQEIPKNTELHYYTSYLEAL